MAKVKLLICPYCGETQPQADRCRSCAGILEPLSRQATHNAMGPWFVRDPDRPHQPGCSYETLVRLVERGQVGKYTIIRGPTTKQFWTIAKRVPGVAHLLTYCHNCDASVDPGDHGCHACGVPFGAYLDRNYLGLPDIRPLPWEAQLDENDAARFSERSLQVKHLGHAAGLSSFGSDEDLRREVGASSPTHRGGVGAHAPARDIGEPIEAEPEAANAPRSGSSAAASDVGANIFDDYAATAGMRSLQRRVAAQQRTIRVLSIVVIIVVVVVAVVALVSLGNKESGTGDPAVGSQGDTTVDGVAGDPAIEEPSPSVSSDVVMSGDEPAPAAVDAGQESEVERAVKFRGEAVYAEVLQLIKAAKEVDRPTKDRIKDYEEALRLLQAIVSEAPADAQPDDIAATIERTNKALERLRLEDFFP